MGESSFISTRISVSRSAIFCASQALDQPVSKLWFVLHGYGQRAEEFLEQFQPVMNDSILVVAPEALSRFYRRHRDALIGASWMTSVEREAEIADYVAYLDAVFEHVMLQQKRRPELVGVLGFSQGSATATRWLNSGVVRADRLVLWGGTPATELRNPAFQEKIAPCAVDWVTGLSDRFTRSEKLQDLLSTVDSPSNPIRLTCFEGGHEIEPETLAAVIQG